MKSDFSGLRQTPDSRRAVLRAAVGTVALLALPRAARSFATAGTVRPPLVTPHLRVKTLAGAETDLASLLRNRVTAAHLMFTGCSETCPIQGAIFTEVQRQLSASPEHFRLLSISIDPLADDAKALRSWLQRYGADPARWTAVAITPGHLDSLFEFARGRATGADRHTAQVYLFNRQAQLVYRTLEMPSASSVAGLMRDIAKSI